MIGRSVGRSYAQTANVIQKHIENCLRGETHSYTLNMIQEGSFYRIFCQYCPAKRGRIQ